MVRVHEGNHGRREEAQGVLLRAYRQPGVVHAEDEDGGEYPHQTGLVAAGNPSQFCLWGGAPGHRVVHDAHEGACDDDADHRVARDLDDVARELGHQEGVPERHPVVGVLEVGGELRPEGGGPRHRRQQNVDAARSHCHGVLTPDVLRHVAGLHNLGQVVETEEENPREDDDHQPPEALVQARAGAAAQHDALRRGAAEVGHIPGLAEKVRRALLQHRCCHCKKQTLPAE
mmetsp:Transcript_82887/g.213580  ORF Transcript_82887/g.213580 Transcript_82887/m.213580 type:complete len:230 (-) Transcript_82887:100-789(-)